MSSNRLWYKLRKMSVDEIRVRLVNALRRQRERQLSRRAEPTPVAAMLETGDVLRLPKKALELVRGSRRKELARFEHAYPERFALFKNQAAARAEALLAGPTKLLGHPIDLRGDVDWHRDPRSGYCWPAEFYGDLSLTSPNGGIDVKYVWELGRQQYLVTLAHGWLCTGDERYARRARELMLDWIEKNPLYCGIHWTSALEAAMRSISWIWTMAALSDWNGWSPEDLRSVAASLCDHAEYLNYHFSFYTSPYNHLMGEATALYLISLLLPTSGHTSGWRTRSRQILVQHSPHQFYEDGFCVEQAVGYHYYTLGFLMLAVHAARKQREPLADLETIVCRAHRAGLAFRQPGGCWPAVGDVDSARAIPVLHENYWNFDSLSALGAALFNDPTLKQCGESVPSIEQPGEEVYWLLGCDGIATWDSLEGRGAHSGHVLKKSGYAIARSDDEWLLFDAGPIAAGLHADAAPSTAHGHADTLQVLYMTAGRPVLIDPGIPQYFGSDEWIDSFRNAESHNTIEIEGAPPVRSAGRLSWSHAAPRPVLDTNLSEEAQLMRGRASWKPGVTVERYVLRVPGEGLWIADWIASDRPREVRWYWQFPADTIQRVFASAVNGSELIGDDVVLMIWSDAPALDVQLASANEGRPLGWIAPGYGILQPGQRATCRTKMIDELLTATSVGEAAHPFEVSVRTRSLLCRPKQSMDNWDATEVPEHVSAEVVWRIQTARGLTTYIAGADSLPNGRSWKTLRGSGDWPAAVHIEEMSSLGGKRSEGTARI